MEPPSNTFTGLFGNTSGPTEYVKKPTVQRLLAGDRMLVQRLDASTPVSLSGSAPIIWELLDDHSTVEGVTKALLERYTDDEQTIAGGVLAAIASFESQDLVFAQGVGS